MRFQFDFDRNIQSLKAGSQALKTPGPITLNGQFEHSAFAVEMELPVALFDSRFIGLHVRQEFAAHNA